jgi:WD40 repeat protein
MIDLNSSRNLKDLNEVQRKAVADMARVIELEQHNLAGWDLDARPEFFLQQLHNRAAALGLSWIRDLACADLRDRNLSFMEQVWIAESNSSTLLKTLTVANCQFHAVRLSDDGHFAYSVGTDQFLRVWDVDAGIELRAIRMDSHRDRVRSLAVTKSGEFAVTGGWDHRVCIWNLRTGGLAGSLDGHSDWVVDVAITSDGRVAASASYDRTVRLWDCRRYQPAGVLKRFRARVRCVGFTPDNQTLLAGDENGNLHFFAVDNPAAHRALRFRDLVIDRIAIDPKGRVGGLSCEPSAVVQMREEFSERTPELGFRYWEDEFRGAVAGMRFYMVDLATAKVLHSFPLHDCGARAITFASDADSLITSQIDVRIRIYDVESGKQKGSFSGHEKGASALAFAPGGGIAASAGNDGTLRIWDVASEKQGLHPDEERGFQAGVSTTAISADGRFGLAVSLDGQLCKWSLENGRLIDDNHLNEGIDRETRVKAFWLSNAADSLVAVSNRALAWFRSAGFESVEIPIDSGDSILSAFLSPDGSAACCITTLGVVHWIDAANSQSRRIFRQEYAFRAVPVPCRASVVVSIDDQPQVQIRRSSDGEIIGALDAGTKEHVQTFTVTPNGSAVFVGYDGGTVRLWSLADLREVRVLKTRANPLAISAVAGASRAVVADANRMLSLWNVGDARVLAQAAPLGRCFAVAITPSGDSLLAGDTVGNICFMRCVAR